MKLRGLYAITPDGANLVDKLRKGLEGGVAMIQYRRKKEKSLAEAKDVVALARRYHVPVIINDDVDLALAAGADGVHLGREDGDLARARKAMKGKILGASCYNDPALAEAAVRAGADYVAFGSVFPSTTKPAAVRAPLSLFKMGISTPLCAIGGITLQNAPQVIAAGADMVAVISDLFDAPDIKARAMQYRKLFA
jgi:thiamine-phosphate pyrophosphorylase